MPYHPNIPQANDDPTVSQQELLDNFQKLNTDFNVNHQAFTQSLNAGMHTKVQFVTGITDPNLAAPVSSLYTKIIGGVAELFFQNNTTANDVTQLTDLTVFNTGTNFTVLTPWGIIIKMGLGTGPTITFDATGPNFSAGTTIYTALVTGQGATVQARILTFVSPFAVMTVIPNSTMYYFVMGSP